MLLCNVNFRDIMRIENDFLKIYLFSKKHKQTWVIGDVSKKSEKMR